MQGQGPSQQGLDQDQDNDFTYSYLLQVAAKPIDDSFTYFEESAAEMTATVW